MKHWIGGVCVKKYLMVVLIALILAIIATFHYKEPSAKTYQDNVISFQYPGDYKVEENKPSDQLGDYKWGVQFFRASKESWFGQEKEINLRRIDLSQENLLSFKDAIILSYQGYSHTSELMTMNISERPVIYFEANRHAGPGETGPYRKEYTFFIPINETTLYILEYEEKADNSEVNVTNIPKDLKMILNTFKVKKGSFPASSSESGRESTVSHPRMLTPEEIVEIMKPYGTGKESFEVEYKDGYYYVTAYDPEYGAIGGAIVDPYTGEIIEGLG